MATCTERTKILSPVTIGTYAISAGIKLEAPHADRVVIAIAIALAESGGNQWAKYCHSNGETDDGLWQIASSHGYDVQRLLEDPLYNAEAMVAISEHGTNWSAWQTYTEGTYKQFLPRAEGAVSGSNIAKEAESVVKEGENIVNKVTGTASDIGKVLEYLTPGTKAFTRTLKIVGGGVILLIAIDELFKSSNSNGSGVIDKVTKGSAAEAVTA